MLRDLFCRLCLLLALLCVGVPLSAAPRTAAAAQACGQHAVAAREPAGVLQVHDSDSACHATHGERCCHACTGALPVAFTLAPLPPLAGPVPPYRLAHHDAPPPEPLHRPPR